MTTGDLDALRVELVRDIVATDDLDVLKAVKRTFTRAWQRQKRVSSGGTGGVYYQTGNLGRHPRRIDRVLPGEEGGDKITNSGGIVQ